MRTLIILLSFCIPVFGEDAGIRVHASSKTNDAGVTISEVFTRDGQTNLVRKTVTKAGALEIRSQRFYHAGLFVGDFTFTPKLSGFSSEAGSPYAMSFQLGESNEVKGAVIVATNAVILDWFSCSNGVFFPVDGSALRKANAFTDDLREFLSPAHVTNTPPEEFGREAEQFIQKHKDQSN